MADDAVFEEQPDGTFDLLVSRRLVDTGLSRRDVADAVLRARLPKGTRYFIQNKLGVRERLTR